MNEWIIRKCKHIEHGLLSIQEKEKWNPAIFTEDHYAKWNKSSTERQAPHGPIHMKSKETDPIEIKSTTVVRHWEEFGMWRGWPTSTKLQLDPSKNLWCATALWGDYNPK